jgi:hypothetical protein
MKYAEAWVLSASVAIAMLASFASSELGPRGASRRSPGASGRLLPAGCEPAESPAGAGDLNGDWLVNIDDLALVTGNFGKTSGDPDWEPSADANGDGTVNVDDLTLVTGNYGRIYNNPNAAIFDPEPSSPWKVPFPCNAFTVQDAEMATGLRVNLPAPAPELVSEGEDVAAVNMLDGFSLFPRITVPFAGQAPDADSFNSDSVFVLGITGPDRGEVIPIDQRAIDDSVAGWPRLIFAVDRLLRESSTYALVVTDGLTAGGKAIRRADGLSVLLNAYESGAAPASRYEGEVRAALDLIRAEEVVAVDSILTLAVFTTRTVSDLPVKLRDRLTSGAFQVKKPDFNPDGAPGLEVFDAMSLRSIVVWEHRASAISDGSNTVEFAPGSLISGLGGEDWNGTVCVQNCSNGLRVTVPAADMDSDGSVSETDVSTLNPASGDELALLVRRSAFSWLARPYKWESGTVSKVVLGSFEAPVYTAAGGGIPVVKTGPGGIPAQTGTGRVMFIGVIPGGAKPAGGWPVAYYAHGGTGSAFDGGTFSCAPVLAERGIATLAFSAPGHGGGPRTSVEIQTLLGSREIVGAGRAVDVDGDGQFEDDGREDRWRHLLMQRVSDFCTLIRSVQLGADFDGDGGSDLATTSERTSVFGLSFGGRTTTVLAAIEPQAAVFAANVPGAGGSLVVDGYFPRMGNLSTMHAYLAARTPPLLNKPGGFDEDVPVKGADVQVGLVAGAEAIQRATDFLLWREQVESTQAYAHHVSTGAKRGAPAKYFLQLVRGDGLAPNPMQTLLVAGGDLAARTGIVRADVEPRFDADFWPVPGTLSRHLALAWHYDGDEAQVGRRICHLVRVQVADYIASGGATVGDPDGAGTLFAGDVFQFPVPADLLEEMEWDPGFDWSH